MLVGCVLNNVLGECAENIEVKTQEDADVVGRCPIYYGDIVIKDTKAESLDFGRLTVLNGSFKVAENFGLKNIDIKELKSVSETLELRDNIELIAVSLLNLSSVKTISIKNNPNLSQIILEEITDISEIKIIQTSIPKIENSRIKKIKTLNISDNMDLAKVSFGGLESIEGELSLNNNHADLEAKFNKLTLVGGSAIFGSFLDLNLPALRKIGKSITILGAYSTRVEILKLESVGMDFIITENDNLTYVSFPELSKISRNLLIQFNRLFVQIDTNAFPKLEIIGGKFLAVGGFENIELPSLQRVNGAMTIESSTSKLDCADTKKRIDKTSRRQWSCKKKLSSSATRYGTHTLEGGGGVVTCKLKYFAIDALVLAFFFTV